MNSNCTETNNTPESEMPGIDGLDNMERTALKMYSPSVWHHPLPECAAIALREIMAKLELGGK